MTGLPAACCSRSGVDAPTFSTDCLAPAYPPYLQDPTQRLGAQAGADEVRQHPWFAGVDWALGRHSEATLARAASRAATMKRVPSKSSGMSGMGSSGSGRAPPTPKRAGDSTTVLGCFPVRRRRQ